MIRNNHWDIIAETLKDEIFDVVHALINKRPYLLVFRRPCLYEDGFATSFEMVQEFCFLVRLHHKLL